MFVLNTLCDLICDVISCYVWSCDMGKSSVYSTIVIEKKENMGIKVIVYLNICPKDGLRIEFTAG